MKKYEEILFAEYFIFRLHKSLQLYLLPVIFVVGVVGNTLSVIILTRPSFRRVDTYTYLTVVSVADTMVLIFGLLRQWLSELTDLDIKDYADWSCKTVMVLNYTFSVYSVWLLIAVTVERYLAVSRPLRVPVHCTRRRSGLVILGLFTTVLAINLHFGWTVRVELVHLANSTDVVHLCSAPPDLDFIINNVWPWIDLSIYLIIPFIIIIVLNSIIIHEVAKARLRRGSMSPGVTSNSHRRSTVTSRHGSCIDDHGINTRLAIMLVTVSFAFLLLTLPMSIWQSIKLLLKLDEDDMLMMSGVALATTVSRLLMFTNHAANFYLYCATGHKFRRQLYVFVRSGCPGANAWSTETALGGHRHQQCHAGKHVSLFTMGDGERKMAGGGDAAAAERSKRCSGSSDRLVAESAI